MPSVNPEELKLLMDAMESAKEKRSQEFPKEEVPQRLDALLHAYNLLTDGSEGGLEVGGLAVWKDGLKNRKRPMYKEPVVVIQVAEELNDAHVDPGLDSGSPYYQEPLTVQLGVIDEDGELALYYFDKRRFRPFSA